MIAPEEDHALDERRLAGDRRIHARADLGDEDAAQSSFAPVFAPAFRS
jgi:hypothetical protein